MAKVKCGLKTNIPDVPCGRPLGHLGACRPRKMKNRANCAVCGRPFWQGINGATNELDARCYTRRRRGLPDQPIVIDPKKRDKLSVSLTFNVTPTTMTRMKKAMDRGGLLFGTWLRGIIEAELKVEEIREQAGL